jgi:hypothetical protein
MWDPTPLSMQVSATCLGSVATPTAPATPSLDPAASHMLHQYLACVAARSWGKVVLETHDGVQRFDFSCQPSPTTYDAPRPRAHMLRAASSLLISGRASARQMSGRIRGGPHRSKSRSFAQNLPNGRSCSNNSCSNSNSSCSNSNSSQSSDSSSNYNSSCRFLCSSCSLNSNSNS